MPLAALFSFQTLVLWKSQWQKLEITDHIGSINKAQETNVSLSLSVSVGLCVSVCMCVSLSPTPPLLKTQDPALEIVASTVDGSF